MQNYEVNVDKEIGAELSARRFSRAAYNKARTSLFARDTKE